MVEYACSAAKRVSDKRVALEVGDCFRPWSGETWMPPPHKTGALQTPASSSSPPKALLRSECTSSLFRCCPERRFDRRWMLSHGPPVHIARLGLPLRWQRAFHGVFTPVLPPGPAALLASPPFLPPGQLSVELPQLDQRPAAALQLISARQSVRRSPFRPLFLQLILQTGGPV